MKIGTKLYIFIGGMTLISIAVFGFYMNNYFSKILNQTYTESIEEYIDNYYHMIELEIEGKKEKNEVGINLANNYINSLGNIQVSQDESVRVGNFVLNKWTLNGRQIQNNYHIVDQLQDYGVGTATIFQKTPKGYVRVSTNVLEDDGSRAVGTFIGYDSPVVKSIENGQRYLGRAKVVGDWYVTAYEPLRINGQIRGIIYVGLPEIHYDEFSEIFKAKSYFGSGYPYIVDSDGIVTAHPNAVGVSIAEYDFFNEMLENKNGVVVYDWKGREKTQYYKYIDQIDSYITVGWYTEDYEAIFADLRVVIIIATLLSLLAVLVILYILGSQITKSLKNAVSAAESIAKGKMNVDLSTNKKDETGVLLKSMDKMATNIKGLVTELNHTANSAVEGKLDNRADVSAFEGEYKTIMNGFNQTLDAVIGPLNVTAEYVDRISKGDIPPKITDDYKGDFNEIKNNLNLCIDSVNLLVTDAKTLATAADEGKLDTRADTARHNGDFRAIIEGVNKTLDNVIGPLNVAAEYVDRISKGDIPPKIEDEYKGDFNEIKNNLNQCIDSVNLLVTDAKMLATAAVEGKLDTRADSSQHNGDFRAIVEGVNKTLDNVIGPLNVAAEYVDRISKGDIPPKIDDEYKGDFNEIKNNLNQCIDSVNLLVTDAKMLATAAVEGKLDTRADSSHHNGDFRAIVEGVNKTLDNVIGPLNVAAEYMDRISKGEMPEEITDTYYGDFNEIKNNINQLIHNLNDFINEMDHMSKEHDLGDIDVVINAGNFSGFYTNMAKGVNDMVNGHINVKKMAMGVFKEYGKGNFDANIEKLPGKKIFINETIDAVQDNLKMIAQEIKDLIKKSVQGQLSYRGDASKYDGDWKEMVEGMNEMIDALLDPVEEAGEVLDVMATGDLRARMKGNYQGDNEKLKKNINLLGDSLSELIIQVNESVQNSASSAAEISSTSDSLAASTQEQAAQSDEVASAVEQMSRTVTDNAMSANRTSEVANSNGEIAKEGAGVVEQTVTKMRDIAKVVGDSAGNIQKLGDSSKQIGEIISVIDDIADQTNLLALNAAIEAARAGEQGRGFAVVADEVRKLAERTTEATKQIATMIKGIQSETDAAVIAMHEGTNEVNSGIELADKAGLSLNKILESTSELIDMINQIATASEEQSATSEQISKNVVSISKVTAESAQRVEDVSKTANELAQSTEDLSLLMQKFKVDETARMLSDKDDLHISSSRGDSRHLPTRDEE